MRTSENIYNYIKSQEMPNEKAYKEHDKKVYNSIGYGHSNRKVTPEMECNIGYMEALFKQDMEKQDYNISKWMSDFNIRLNQNQFDALSSLCYSVGWVGLRHTRILKMIMENKANTNEFKELWLNYDKMRGVKNNALGKRRQFEYQLWTKQ